MEKQGTGGAATAERRQKGCWKVGQGDNKAWK